MRSAPHAAFVLVPVLVASFMLPAPARALTLHIRADSTYESPTPIQDAISQAMDDAGAVQDTIWLGPGTYHELSPGRENAFYQMILAPGIVVKSEAGPEVTILDAQSGGAPPGATLRAAYLPGCDELTEISGITFRGGYCQTVTGTAGIAVLGGSPRIENCVFDEPHGGAGGSISISAAYPYTSASPTITGCTFDNSQTCCGPGGAIWVESNCTPEITYNTFLSDSTASTGGGAVAYTHLAAGGELAYNTFIGNKVKGTQGGAVFVAYEANPDIHDNLFQGNFGVEAGSGAAVAYIGGGGGSFHHNVIVGNTAEGGGGAVFINAASPTIAHCVILGNSGSTGAGGIQVTDAGGFEYATAPVFENVLVAANLGAGGVNVQHDPGAVGTPTVTFSGSNIYGNEGGEFVGMASPIGADGNESVDPLACTDAAQGLQDCSPFVFHGQTFDVAVPTCPCTTAGQEIQTTWGALRAQMSPSP